MGTGLDLAREAGANLARLDHQLFYSTGLVDPRDPSGKRGLHAFNRDAIWVNALGKRFVSDGQPDPKKQMPAVLKQDPANYWAVFDSTSRPRFFVSGSDWNDTNVVQQLIFANPKMAEWVKQEDSIGALALACKTPNLEQTVARWNRMIESGNDQEFHRFHTPAEDLPPKIEKPPYFAVHLFPLARKSLGGVAVDLSCRVLDQKAEPITGLFAVGELTGVAGVNGRAALEGTMLGPGIFMGRVAAKEAVRKITRALKSPTPAPLRTKFTGNRSTEPETLKAWQEVLGQIIATPRPGYLHFEKVHALVLARNFDCAKCHTEASPLAATEAQIDRESMIKACAICHGGVSE
jgi:succinate dehydrogenase/fumarate reductase flavoprotein subunit